MRSQIGGTASTLRRSELAAAVLAGFDPNTDPQLVEANGGDTISWTRFLMG